MSDDNNTQLEPCPWCPTERRETYNTEGGIVGVIIHDTNCFLAACERRQILTPKGVAAWNSRASIAAPQVKDDVLEEWLKPMCNRLHYGRCSTLYCLKRGGYTGEPADYSIATCEAYEAYNALSSPVAPSPIPEHPYFAHARACTSCGPNGLCAEGLQLYNSAATPVSPSLKVEEVSAGEQRVCVKCGHYKFRSRETGYCREVLNWYDDTYCGCKCEFIIATPVPPPFINHNFYRHEYGECCNWPADMHGKTDLAAEIMKEVKRYDDGNGCTRRQLVGNILILISQTFSVSASSVTSEEREQNARNLIDAWRDEWHLEPEPEMDGANSAIYESLVSRVANFGRIK